MEHRGTIRLICAVAGIVLAFLWLFSVKISGFAAPDWVPPSSVVALAVAVLL